MENITNDVLAEPQGLREAMFSAARAQVQALPDAPDPVPFMCGLEAQNAPTFAAELTPADVDAEVDRIEREAQEADTHYDRMKNNGELQRRRDEWYLRDEMHRAAREVR